jgi:NAD(P)-dependent dehydrogenase (short-subunit alcohol dehydrogenase family)
MFSLQDQRVLVVGGSSGIGLATAEAAATSGASVTLASRSKDKLEAAAKTVGHGTLVRVLDTGDEAAIEAFFKDAAPYDHVVLSASATSRGEVKSMPLADAYASMESKFWGAYRVARAAPIKPGGSLTLISGFLSIRPKKGNALQGAINAAVEALTKGLSLELAPVRVNCVSPGLIDTPLWSGMAPDARAAMLDQAAKTLPAGRVGQGDHIALQILAFMANPFATGSVIYLDGGGALI